MKKILMAAAIAVASITSASADMVSAGGVVFDDTEYHVRYASTSADTGFYFTPEGEKVDNGVVGQWNVYTHSTYPEGYRSFNPVLVGSFDDRDLNSISDILPYAEGVTFKKFSDLIQSFHIDIHVWNYVQLVESTFQSGFDGWNRIIDVSPDYTMRSTNGFHYVDKTLTR